MAPLISGGAELAIPGALCAAAASADGGRRKFPNGSLKNLTFAITTEPQ